MSKLIPLVFLGLILTACDGGAGSSSPQALAQSVPVGAAPVSQPAAQPSVIPSPAPSVSPSPSPSPSPSVTVQSYTIPGQGDQLCWAFARWTSATQTLEANYGSYFYSFASTGVTVTYTAGLYAGQTNPVLDPTTINLGGSVQVPGCVVQVNNGAVISFTNNEQGA